MILATVLEQETLGDLTLVDLTSAVQTPVARILAARILAAQILAAQILAAGQTKLIKADKARKWLPGPSLTPGDALTVFPSERWNCGAFLFGE